MLEKNTLRQAITESALFADVDLDTIAKILDAADVRTVQQGEYVYRQGENHSLFHIILEGTVELSMKVEGDGTLIVGCIGPGGHFGETSLLTGSRNCISVRALNRLILLSFDAESFFSLLLFDRRIEHRLCVDLAQRLRVSFHDHADSLAYFRKRLNALEPDLESTLLVDLSSTAAKKETAEGGNSIVHLSHSTLTRQIMRAVNRFGNNTAPVLITGETGTGRRMLAREIHRTGILRNGPYSEIDVRNADPIQLEGEIFGREGDVSAYTPFSRLGLLERQDGGTVVLYHAEHLEPDFQRQLIDILKKQCVGITEEIHIPLNAKIILICTDALYRQDGHDRLLPRLYALLAKQHFRAAPLRMHRRDIPLLVQYYLKRYCRQYGKKIITVEDRTMGMFMKYEWPGNLTEMASVIQRAVILGKSGQPLNDRMLLGLPRSEGKWEFNLLRLPVIRNLFTSRFFPLLPRAVTATFVIFLLITLFTVENGSDRNAGLILSWAVGWPILIFSFFFLGRTWCSVCGLAVPGLLAQHFFTPRMPTPVLIKRYSGWIMTVFCILLFWIEIAWDAYRSSRLTGSIILAITLGALLFSTLYQRRVWCRYLCPLGALNALFSMPSVLELRANTQVCINRCQEHSCYTGTEENLGCPMFRHPFLVDNNRDCIMCGKCVKNCKLNSIHLNLRLAPQELWNQQVPRLEDSILTISLAAIVYPFTINQQYPQIIDKLASSLGGFDGSTVAASSIILCACLVLHLVGYGVLSQIIARLTRNEVKTTASRLGYGMIPLVLSAFLAVHLEIFAGGAIQLVENVPAIWGLGGLPDGSRVISRDGVWILQLITVMGGLSASLYATRRIIKRLSSFGQPSLPATMLSAILLCISAIAYLAMY